MSKYKVYFTTCGEVELDADSQCDAILKCQDILDDALGLYLYLDETKYETVPEE